MTDQGRRIFNMVLAVLVSVSAWVFVVYNYKPMTEMRYSQVPVSFTGEEELAERGLAVSEASNETITVVLKQKRVDSRNFSADDIDITANVSGCTAGENSVAISISGPDGTTVVSSDEESIDVTVGRIKTQTMEIDVRYSEDTPDGEEPIALDLSMARADVSCTADRLSSIDKVAALLDYDEVTDDIKSFTVKLAALDKEGNELQHVVIEPDEISLDACRGYTKTVSLTVPVSDADSTQYERSYVAPSTVTIKGSKDDIETVESISAQEVDISGYYESQDIPLTYELPDGIYIAKNSYGLTLKLTVTEKEEEEEEEEDSES